MRERERSHRHQEETNQAGQQVKRRRPWWRRLLHVFVFLLLLAIALHVLVDQLYHGPKNLADVVGVMPGVPLFPLSEIAPNNRQAQRAMALPIAVMRLQGAQTAHLAQLQSPGDQDFIVEWYRRLLPSQGWRCVGQDRIQDGIRMIFLREQEGLQVTVGRTRDILTPVQLLYLSGITVKQRTQLLAAAPEPTPLPPLPKPKIRVPVAPTPPPGQQDNAKPSVPTPPQTHHAQ